MKKTKTFAQLFLSLLLLFCAFVLEICVGAEKIPWKTLFGIGDTFEKIILWKLRFPRALLVLVSGILLGGSGAVFQLFFRNPLAEPGILGITSGATLGAVIASAFIPASFLVNSKFFLTFHFSDSSSNVMAFSPINLFAFFGAIFAGLLVTALSFSKKSKNSSIMILLCGTALGTLYSSVSSLILLTKSDSLHSIYSWILGSFNGRGWNELFFILIPASISVFLMFIVSKPLNLLGGGETSAASLGVEIGKLRILVLVCGALATSCVVCAGGTIGFVGLIAPHICRKITGPKSETLIPFSMIFSGILLLLSDTLCRIIIRPSELPTGIITSILGVPFFIALCFEKN